jgi:hypothetical protein
MNTKDRTGHRAAAQRIRAVIERLDRAASFFISNLEWKIEGTSPPEDEHHWVVLRTSEDEDTRDFRYFVEF